MTSQNLGQRRWKRRNFLHAVAAGGIASLLGCQSGRLQVELEARDELADISASVPGSAAGQFLKEQRRALNQVTLRVLTEDTPPSRACQILCEREFTPLSGIEVEWIMEPLDQVFARTAVDTAQHSGFHDLFYLDQSWRGRFGPLVTPLEPWLARSDLSYPGWDFDDFLPSLIRHIGSWEHQLISIPYDITIFIGALRRDVFDRLQLSAPNTLSAWREACYEVKHARIPGLYGMTAQWQLGHYALNCNMTAWLWGHGGSIFYADGTAAIGDAQAVEALEFMLSLLPFTSPRALSWDWHGEARSFARGEAALFGSWAEFFPLFDDPKYSSIVGLAEPFAMPNPNRLRPPEQCGFGETPGVAHQGGSGIAISRHSPHPEAAWIFLQWVTSPDIAVRACLLGGGASATRASTFKDPRILARKNQIGPGTTRHFGVMQHAIEHQMGTEPSHPKWPELARLEFPVELGRLLTQQQSPAEVARAMARAAKAIIR